MAIVTSGELTSEVLDRLEALGPIEDEWRRLAERRSNAFITPEWYRAWWASVGESGGYEPAIIVVRRPNGGLAGVIPLAFATDGWLRPARFAGAILGDWFHPAAEAEDEPGVAAAAMKALDSHRPGWKALILERIPADSALPGAMIASARRRTAAISRSPVSLPYVDLRGLTEDRYLDRSSPGFRKRIRYLERSLATQHDVRVRVTADPDLIAADLDLFYELHLGRRKEAGGSWIGGANARRMICNFATAAL
ncbi:MAG: hypothetical protein QOE53_2866, partial [Pseudonocardiales bacterium]|nr:hypothetical protein [Pseudonocardiales bacterium]